MSLSVENESHHNGNAEKTIFSDSFSKGPTVCITFSLLSRRTKAGNVDLQSRTLATSGWAPSLWPATRPTTMVSTAVARTETLLLHADNFHGHSAGTWHGGTGYRRHREGGREFLRPGVLPPAGIRVWETADAERSAPVPRSDAGPGSLPRGVPVMRTHEFFLGVCVCEGYAV